MPLRFYLSRYVNAGTAQDPEFLPSAAQVLGPGVSWTSVDGSLNDPTDPTQGRALFIANVTAAQHAQLLADPLTNFAPFEDAAGNPLGLNDPISSISAANRTAINNFFENNNIPTEGLQGSDPIRALLRRVVRRFLIRQIVDVDDITELLDQTVSQIPVARRNAFAAKLAARGFDTSGITGATTVRQVIGLIGNQMLDDLRANF